MSDGWYQEELRRLWFRRVEFWLRQIEKDPQRTLEQGADYFGCGASTWRHWRRRYWRDRLAREAALARSSEV